MAENTTKNLNLEAVKLVVEKGRSVPSVALDLGIHEKTLYKWVSDYKKDSENAFPGSGRLKPQDELIRQLKRRVADLEEENAILKKAAAIFANHRK
ncbi:transposase [Desulforamulus putei DSM 12395]|uniref:Transposase n=1 Tax=Desulforamulus putei DSM 12395 TaxID=1121429 RepID=A0A1M5CBP2_9FIRM|nr:transposase [Desulforamulus putei DSM 12395]